MNRPPYKHPPVVEALCEIHFEPGPPWDVTIFGHYYDRKGRIPAEAPLKGVEVSVELRADTLAQHVRESGLRAQLTRNDGIVVVHDSTQPTD